MIEHEACGATSITLTPETAQTLGLSDVNVTLRAELAVALRAGGMSSVAWVLSGPKAMVWASLITVNGCVFGVAPVWLAVIEQRPAPTRVTVTPWTVQTVGLLDANVTGNPVVAVAPGKVKGAVPSV